MSHQEVKTKITWGKKAKLWVAAAVFAGAAVFGGVAFNAPDAPEPDEQAGVTWSFSVGGGDDGGKWSGTLGVTWS